MEKRQRERTKRRLTCELVVGTDRYPAIVRDISPSGLFLQTRAKPKSDTAVEVIFRAHDRHPEVRVEAGVARQRVVPARLQAAVPEGVGLELLNPPPEYQELLARHAAPASDREPAQTTGGQRDQAIRTFRVRVTQRGTPNSRVLTVRSQSPAGARARALAQAGRGWKIADIQEI